jgi:hypothetical protein
MGVGRRDTCLHYAVGFHTMGSAFFLVHDIFLSIISVYSYIQVYVPSIWQVSLHSAWFTALLPVDGVHYLQASFGVVLGKEVKPADGVST